MQLLGFPVSPFVRHVLIVLDETGIECEFKVIDTNEAAQLSPTKKVPLLIDGEAMLSDSTTICRYLREKAGQAFISDIQQHDVYCLVNTLMDSTINVFLYERFGMDTSSNAYFKRQQDRVIDGLQYLESLALDPQTMDKDTFYRTACYLNWGLYRERLQLDNHPKLNNLLEAAHQIPAFEKTLPDKLA